MAYEEIRARLEAALNADPFVRIFDVELSLDVENDLHQELEGKQPIWHVNGWHQTAFDVHLRVEPTASPNTIIVLPND